MGTSVSVRPWGLLPDGRTAQLYTIHDGSGRSVTLSDYGGIVTSIIIPDKDGQPGDIALSYDTLEEYLRDDAYFGAMIGRFANRISGASFPLNGQQYEITANEGQNTLHGGTGFSRKLWKVKILDSGVSLQYTSPDGEDGFPGTLDTTVTVTFADALVIDFRAVSDRDTVCSLTNHTYFNLACGGDVLSHLLTVRADEYLETGAFNIPTAVKSVAGTPFDFRKQRPVENGWYDHSLILNGDDPAVTVADPKSGRTLTLRTNMPCVQLYAAGWLSSRAGKTGTAYGKNSGLAIEPQHYPDSPNRPDFPSPVLPADEEYRHVISLSFGILS